MAYSITARSTAQAPHRVHVAKECKHGNALDYSACQECLDELSEAINLPSTTMIDAAEHRDDPYGIFFLHCPDAE